MEANHPQPSPRWNPSDYAANSSAQQVWARELIAKLALRGDEHVLDIGCGDGKVTAEIAAAVPRGRVLGIDSSPEMIAHAASSFTTVENLHFTEMDARELTFRAAFDVVFSNAALHWIREHQLVLRGIRQALRPGGRLLLQMGGRGNAETALRVVGEVTKRPQWRPCFEGFDFRYGFYGPEEYGAWLAEEGLLATRVELIPKDMIHADRAALGAWFRTTWMPWIDRVPADQQASFIAEVVDAFAEAHPPDALGRLQLPMKRLEVEAGRGQ